MVDDSLPHLIVVAYALAPGPGGPEAEVNATLVRALAAHWPAGVSAISGGRRADTELAGCTLHALGSEGAHALPAPRFSRLAAMLARHRHPDGRRRFLARAFEHAVWRTTGWGLKLNAWQRAASAQLERTLDRHRDACVWSRALPFASIAAVARVRRKRRFRWLVNLNDPLPADLWPGLYASHPATDRRTRTRFSQALEKIDGLSFPCRALRDLECRGFARIETLPSALLPHIARPIRPVAPAGTRRLRIAFAGALHKTRISDAFACAVRRWCQAHPNAARDLELGFALAVTNVHTEAFLAALPAGITRSLGPSGPALDRELASADVLLDLKAEADAPLLNSKTTAYLGHGKPIWVVGPRQGTVSSVLGRHGCGWQSARDDADAIEAALTQIHRAWRACRLHRHRPSSELLARFSAERQVEDLARLVRAVAIPGTRRGQRATGALLGADWP